MKRVSLKEYAEKHNDKLTRRGHKMSWSYIYRLIRQDIGCDKIVPKNGTRQLWFKYEFEGDKNRIWIILPN